MTTHYFRPRALFDDNNPDGYLVSDKDFVKDNWDLVVDFLNACETETANIFVVKMKIEKI